MTLAKELLELLDEEKWSADVETKWEPPEGFFTRSQDEIASGLKSASDSLQQAMSRLNFYINRSGKSDLEGVKDKLRALYKGKEES